MLLNRLVSFRAIAVSALVLSSSAYAIAQQAPTTRVRGTIESLDGETLHIKSREGSDVSVHLPAAAPVAGVAKMALSDV
jgi:hypothetical protein